MGAVVLDMSISVDGCVAGPDDGPEHGLGVGGVVLHAWLADGGLEPRSYRPTDEAGGLVLDEVLATGAVLTGRHTFEYAGQWGGDHHDGVPIFVLTRAVPDQPAPGHARYVSDLASAVAQAKEAAGERNVLLHGATAAQALLRAGLVDEIALHVVPVLLGAGRRLFDGLPPDHVELDLVRALDGPNVQHLHYRVRKES
jgi:dihydrofolate reductase